MNRFFLPVLLLAATPALAATPQSRRLPPASPAPRESVEKLGNGLKLVSKIDRTAPRVALSLLVRVGASDETAQNAGWRRLYAGAVARGVPKGFDRNIITSDELGLQRAAERAGGDAGITVGDDLIEFWATGDSAKAPQLLQLVIAMWKTPRLSEDDLTKSRTRLSDQLDAQDLDIAAQTSAALRTQEFVDKNGAPLSYGLNEVGTTQSLAFLTNERVRALGERVVNAPATLSAVGDVNLPQLRATLGALPSPTIKPVERPAFAPLTKVKPALVVRELPIQAAWVFISYPLGRVRDEDAPALRLLSAALSDTAQARLTKRLLGDNLVEGAPTALSLSSQFVLRRDGSELLISAQTAPSSVENVKNILLDEVRRLRTAPLSKTEFEAARNFSRGDWAISRQSLRERAFLIGQNPAIGGASDAQWPRLLASQTPQSAQKAAQRYLQFYAVALVMPRS